MHCDLLTAITVTSFLAAAVFGLVWGIRSRKDELFSNRNGLKESPAQVFLGVFFTFAIGSLFVTYHGHGGPAENLFVTGIGFFWLCVAIWTTVFYITAGICKLVRFLSRNS